MKDWLCSMQYLLFPCFRLPGPSFPFVLVLCISKNIRWKFYLAASYHSIRWLPFNLGDLTLFFPLQVFDMLRTMMFILGMGFVFVGISLLAPEDSKGMSSAADCTLICSTVFFIAYHIQSCGRNYNLANVKLRGNLAIDLSLL